MTTGTEKPESAVLQVRGVHWATEKAVVESVLGRRPGVRFVEANPRPDRHGGL
jgi:Cu2+-exporting ATPase